eukprot:TRINITY_DN999_c0_g2_i2.p1 TRINITY_DN999_c0_g2~~TRINITY_DN999_c0_g2_i2.p1  ORF type:complete len:479 (+),score=114.37 TRINITY_DN999_c0_g2_i2:55-1437(+)
MGEESDVEEDDVEEEGPFEPTDTASMPDGARTFVLGGWSKLDTVAAAAELLKTEETKTLLVQGGEYESLNLNSELSGLRILGTSSVVFKGSSSITTPTLFLKNITLTAEDDKKVLQISCEEGKPSCKVELTSCNITGGRNSVEIHTHSCPKFIACSIKGSVKTAIYCYPRGRPVLCAGYSLVSSSPMFSTPPADDADPPPTPLTTLSEKAIAYVTERDPDHPKFWKIAVDGTEGYIEKAALNYTEPMRCTLSGRGNEGSVGVFLDDGDCQLRETDISDFQTGCYISGRCKNTNIENNNISNCLGVGVHLSTGCRVGVRGCRVRTCDHYGLLVSSGKSGDCQEPSKLCKQRMDALANDDFDLVKTIEETLKSKQITFNDTNLTWTKSDGSSGCWGHDETHSILRQNIFLSDVRIGKDTLPSLFENTIVAPSKLISDIPFKVNGYSIVDKEPKIPTLTRDEE